MGAFFLVLLFGLEKKLKRKANSSGLCTIPSHGILRNDVDTVPWVWERLVHDQDALVSDFVSW